jgi:hypothetical protein
VLRDLSMAEVGMSVAQDETCELRFIARLAGDEPDVVRLEWIRE